jgi:anti-sigma B factor antagonist
MKRNGLFANKGLTTREVSMTGLEVSSREKNGVAVVYLSGFLDAHTAPDFEKVLRDLIDKDMIRLVVNLSGLHYIASAGVGVFMGFIEEVRNRGGDIKLAEPTEKVYRVFDLLGFHLLYDICKKEDEAVGKYLRPSAAKKRRRKS